MQSALQTKERELEEGEKNMMVVSRVKEKCESYLGRPLALQDTPDVVSHYFLISLYGHYVLLVTTSLYGHYLAHFLHGHYF